MASHLLLLLLMLLLMNTLSAVPRSDASRLLRSERGLFSSSVGRRSTGINQQPLDDAEIVSATIESLTDGNGIAIESGCGSAQEHSMCERYRRLAAELSDYMLPIANQNAAEEIAPNTA